MKHDANLAQVEKVAWALGDLRERAAFLGGCAVGLLLTDPAAAPVRVTRDVDLVVEAASRRDLHDLEEELSRRGLRHDTREGAPICRWIFGDLVVDVMPTDPSLLGFGNRWYPDALRTAVRQTLPSGLEIAVVSAPCFLATKLEAFRGRGEGDFLASHDLEDFVPVVDGRAEVVEDVRCSGEALRDWLREEVSKLLAEARFVSALPGHLPADAASQARLKILLGRLRAIAGPAWAAPEP